MTTFLKASSVVLVVCCFSMHGCGSIVTVIIASHYYLVVLTRLKHWRPDRHLESFFRRWAQYKNSESEYVHVLSFKVYLLSYNLL